MHLPDGRRVADELLLAERTRDRVLLLDPARAGALPKTLEACQLFRWDAAATVAARARAGSRPGPTIARVVPDIDVAESARRRSSTRRSVDVLAGCS